MHREFSPRRFKDFDLRSADKQITAWGSMALMKRMREHLELGAALGNSGLPFLSNTPERLGTKRIALLRGDSGLSDHTGSKGHTQHGDGYAKKRQWMRVLWDQAKQFDLPVKFAVNHPPRSPNGKSGLKLPSG